MKSRRTFLKSTLLSSGGIVFALTQGLSAPKESEGLVKEMKHGQAGIVGEFIEAIQQGNKRKVTALLDKNELLLFARDGQDISMYSLAYIYQQSDIASIFLAKGYLPDFLDLGASGDSKKIYSLSTEHPELFYSENRIGFTALHYASLAWQVQSVYMLIATGANVNALANDGLKSPPLLLALSCPDSEKTFIMAQNYLGNGGNPNATFTDSTTALHLAVKNGHLAVVELLLRKGANPEAVNGENKTPLDIARERKLNAIAEVLLKSSVYRKEEYTTRFLNGKDYSRRLENVRGIPQQLIDRFITLSHTDMDETKRMLHQLPDLLYSASSWDEICIEACAHIGKEDIVNYLADLGAPVSICTATMLGQSDLVKNLIKSNPSLIHERGAHDFPLLMYCAFGKENLDLAEFLIDNGLNVNSNVLGRGALLEAANRGHIKLAELLLEKGADPNLNNFGTLLTGTPLDISIKRKNSQITSLLRKYGARG